MAQALEFLFHLNFFFGLKMSLLDSVSMNVQKIFLLRCCCMLVLENKYNLSILTEEIFLRPLLCCSLKHFQFSENCLVLIKPSVVEVMQLLTREEDKTDFGKCRIWLHLTSL